VNAAAAPARPAFAVLLPVYRGDHPKWVEAAFASVVHQSLAPTQVVIVRDGPVPARLAALLDQLSAHDAVSLVALARNAGLAAALNAGLDACRPDIVARQDADDLSAPGRFAATVPLVASRVFDLVGGALREFEAVPGDLGEEAVRVYPAGAAAIRRAARRINPLAHPTVVFRRAALAAAGGYRPFHHLEDYDLWVRLLLAGWKVGNVPNVLVDYRVSAEAYRRRGGLKTLRAEWALQGEFLRRGFTNPAEWARNLVLRGGFELAPLGLRRRALAHLWRP
jgi:glycosyltransferase involved in cell wall biosynthesis